MPLPAAKVRPLREPARCSDGGVLHLFVSNAGSKSWVQRITIDGLRKDIGLGGSPAVILAQARERAAGIRAAVAQGRDPLAEKCRPIMPTFREAARAVHVANKPRWRNARCSGSWLQTLERHAMPVLDNPPVDRIGRAEVLRLLDGMQQGAQGACPPKRTGHGSGPGVGCDGIRPPERVDRGEQTPHPGD